jgi:hypothetical protein
LQQPPIIPSLRNRITWEPPSQALRATLPSMVPPGTEELITAPVSQQSAVLGDNPLSGFRNGRIDLRCDRRKLNLLGSNVVLLTGCLVTAEPTRSPRWVSLDRSRSITCNYGGRLRRRAWRGSRIGTTLLSWGRLLSASVATPNACSDTTRR